MNSLLIRDILLHFRYLANQVVRTDGSQRRSDSWGGQHEQLVYESATIRERKDQAAIHYWAIVCPIDLNDLVARYPAEGDDREVVVQGLAVEFQQWTELPKSMHVRGILAPELHLKLERESGWRYALDRN